MRHAAVSNTHYSSHALYNQNHHSSTVKTHPSRAKETPASRLRLHCGPICSCCFLCPYHHPPSTTLLNYPNRVVPTPPDPHAAAPLELFHNSSSHFLSKPCTYWRILSNFPASTRASRDFLLVGAEGGGEGEREEREKSLNNSEKN